MRIAVAGFALILAACVTTSNVVPAGQDAYMISAANDTCGNCTPPQIRVTQEASAYCTKLGKAMIVKDTQEQTFDIGFGHRTTITFNCVTPTKATPYMTSFWTDGRNRLGCVSQLCSCPRRARTGHAGTAWLRGSGP